MFCGIDVDVLTKDNLIRKFWRRLFAVNKVYSNVQCSLMTAKATRGVFPCHRTLPNVHIIILHGLSPQALFSSFAILQPQTSNNNPSNAERPPTPSFLRQHCFRYRATWRRSSNKKNSQKWKHNTKKSFMSMFVYALIFPILITKSEQLHSK